MAKTKTKRMKDVDGGLQGLGDIAKSLKSQVPKLRALPDLSKLNLAERVEATRQTAKQIEEDVASAVAKLCEIRRTIAQYRDDRLALKLVSKETAGDVSEMEDYLERVFSLEDTILLQVAAVAYLKARLSQEFHDFAEVKESLDDLINRQILVQTPAMGPEQGPISIGYSHYKVAEKFGVEPEDLAEATSVVERFSRRFKQLVHQQREEQIKEAEEKADISLEEMLAGSNGKCFIEVPPEPKLDREGNIIVKDGREQWLGGGKLLVEATERDIIPLVGIGSIEPVVRKMVFMGVRLLRHQLEWDTPPGSGREGFQRVQAGVMRTRDLDSHQAEEYVNKLRGLWYMVHRGVKSLENKEAMENLKQEFSDEADITPVVFYGLNGKSTDGTALLEFKAAFKLKNSKEIYQLFFLAKIFKKAGKRVVEIVSLPEHLTDLLGEFVGKQYPVENNFAQCPQRLGQVLRGIRSRVEHDYEIAKD